MRRRFLSTVLVLSSTVLAACGGGSGDSASGNSGSSGNSSGGTNSGFLALPAAGTGPFGSAELTTYERLSTIELTNLTPAAPNVTTATYDGFVVVTDPTTVNDGYLGRSTMTANFAGNQISGTTANFLRASNIDTAQNTGPTTLLNQVGGTIAYSNGTISGNLFTVTLAGTLTDNGTPIAVDVDFQGAFGQEATSGQELLLGLGDGTVDQGSGATNTNGVLFGLERP